MHAEFIGPDDQRWLRLLERMHHDVYQLPQYNVVAGHYEGGEPVAFVAESGTSALLMPLLIRSLPTDLDAQLDGWDATTGYGYSGPVTTPGMPDTMVSEALGCFRELASQRGLVSAFIRMHPLFSPPIAVLERFGTVVKHGPVIYVDLTKRVEEWWVETRSDHRRNIARLLRLGYSAEMDDWTGYSSFRAIYRNTMRRLSASPFYHFSDEYFDELRQKLGDALHLCTVRAPNGDIAASGLFLLAGRIAEYHLGGTEESHFHLAPSKLMLDFARRWAKERGASVLNLGGGFGGTVGSLQHFKTGFSKSEADFHTVRIVFDEQRYARLSAAGRALRSENGSVDASDDFFPAYRRPLHASVRMSVSAPV